MIRPRPLAAVAFVTPLVLALACHTGVGPDGKPRNGPPAGPRPDPIACTRDADCTFGFGIDDAGCCLSENSPTAGAQTVAFGRWAYARASSGECASVSCAPLPSPQPPPPGCLSTPRCNAGKCGDACGPAT